MEDQGGGYRRRLNEQARARVETGAWDVKGMEGYWWRKRGGGGEKGGGL